MMKISFVLNSHWSSNMGGAEYQAYLLMQSLERLGEHQLSYLCRNAKTSDKKVQTVKANSIIAKYAYFVDALKLYKLLKASDPDVVYHRNGGAYTGICAYYCKKHHKRFVWNLAHDKDVTPAKLSELKNPLKFIDKMLLSYGIKNKQIIIAQTQEQQHLLQSHYGIKDSRLIANYHPVPSINKKTNNIKQIVWVANLKPAKRPELYLDLVKHFSQNNHVKFLMVGRAHATYQSMLINTTQNYRNFEYMGELAQEEVNSLIEQSDLFVNTSQFEGFPNTFIQSWLRATPVLSVGIDPSQIIKNENLGVVANNLAEMIQTVDSLIANPSRFEAMGRRAVEYAKAHHSLDNIEKVKLLMGLAD